MTTRADHHADVLAWATSLADRVVPDEVDLAPDLMAAYLRGGQDRRELFAGPRADPGAFGAGFALQLPHILDCLSTCFVVVKGFLGDPAVNTMVASASLVAAVRQLRAARPSTPTPSPQAATGADAERAPEQPAPTTDVGPGPGTSESETPADAEVEADPVVVDRARAALESLVGRLREHPATADRPEETAEAVLTVVAADPPRALQALTALDEAPG